MKWTLALGFFWGAAAWAADPTPLDIKTGEWEYTLTVQVANTRQGNSATNAASPPAISQNCVKREDLAKLIPVVPAKSCKMTMVTSSTTKFDANVDCNDGDSKSTSTFVVQALSSESINFSVVAAGTTHGKAVYMTVKGTGKWLSAACVESK